MHGIRGVRETSLLCSRDEQSEEEEESDEGIIRESEKNAHIIDLHHWRKNPRKGFDLLVEESIP